MIKEIKVGNKTFSYNIYKRRKKNNKFRIITAPQNELKEIQKQLANLFYLKTEESFSDEVTGFRLGVSIKENAKKHIQKDWVINIDLKDFFPSTSTSLVRWAIKHSGIDSVSDYPFEDHLLTLDGGLPQGSPASPVLANYIAMHFVDPIVKEVLNTYLMTHSFDYSRYADDITFSLNSNSKIDRSFLKKITKEIKARVESETCFKIAPNKIKIRSKGQRQEVTGIVVNEQFSINRKERLRLRAEIHHVAQGKKKMTSQLRGKLNFIKQINDNVYNKLTKDLV